MLQRLLHHKFRTCFFSVIVSVCVFLSFYQVRKSYWDRDVITSDGYGYYSYLPAIFIYGDMQYNFFEKAYRANLPNAPMPSFCNDISGKKANKYFAGEAVLLTPFFLAAHAASHMLSHPVDGYSSLYHLFVAIAAAFYLGIGCWYCIKFQEMHEISFLLSAFAISVVVFGTNLFHYAAVEPSMSHVYSFAAISAFMYYVKKYFNGQCAGDFIKAAFCLGIIILIRPLNVIILLAIPFLYGQGFSIKKIWETVFKHKTALIVSIGIVGMIVLIQPALYYLQTGKFFVWSYQGEGFNFLNPELLNILFSYKKGWFVYTPVAFIALLGFIYLFRKSKFEAIALFVFLFVVTYVLSCWWQWQYGMSFGLRAFIDFYPFIALLICYAVLLLNSKIYKIIIVELFLAALALNQIQSYQYRHFILHWDSMDKEKYWKVFLKTDKEYEGILWK